MSWWQQNISHTSDVSGWEQLLAAPIALGWVVVTFLRGGKR